MGLGPVPLPGGLWSSFATTLPASKPHSGDRPMSSLVPWAVSISEFLVQGLGWRTNVGYSLPLPIGLQEAVYEDVPVGTVILTVTASDADSGNFAVIEYSLVDGEGKFAINPTTVSGQWRAWVWE